MSGQLVWIYIHYSVLCPGFSETSVSLSIKADEYLKMAPDLSVKIFVNAHVQETQQAFVAMESVEFVKPELEAYVSVLCVSVMFSWLLRLRYSANTNLI